MEKDTLIADAILPYLDSKYAIDNKKEGYDCLNFILGYFESLGIKMPHEWKDWTLENYGKRALADPTKAHKAFEEFVQTLGEEIPEGQIRRGDLVLFNVMSVGTYAGIYFGNGNVAMMFDKGMRMCPLAVFRQYLKQVRRLL